jgi:hypothetical protein
VVALQPSGSREQLLAGVEEELRTLENLCGTLERALMRKRWSDLEQGLRDSRRVTHALQNAIERAAGVRDAQFDAQLHQRIAYVHAIRENQLARLRQFNTAVSERLQLIARFKSAVRSMTQRQRPVSRLARLNQLT